MRQLSKQYGEDSGMLIHISPMDFKVYVIADSYDKLSAGLHRTKVGRPGKVHHGETYSHFIVDRVTIL